MAKNLAATRKSTHNKNKGKASTSIFIDSDSDDLFPASIAFSLGKLPDDSFDCGSSKKKFKFDFDSTVDKKVDFWNSSHESLFLSLKDKTLVHGRGWAKNFSVPMVVYEHLIHLFYANLRSPKAGEIESLVLGKRIFLECKKFDSMFGISCSGILSPPKNGWPSDCDVSFDQTKCEFFLHPSLPIPSHLGPKEIPFKICVIAHIVATTLLPRDGSHSTLTQRDTLFAYCLVFDIKTDFDCLAAIPVKSKPSSSTSMSTTKLNVALQNIGEMHTKLDAMAITAVQVPDLMTKLTVMSEQVDSMKDLLLFAHFKINSVKDVYKKTGDDVARIHLRLDQIVKEQSRLLPKFKLALRPSPLLFPPDLKKCRLH
ncbi:hypothetical protein KY284_032643 [Solanum tuberosum]|nr:hypothetical protein KY284_032643 [Solanum tuberosum]